MDFHATQQNTKGRHCGGASETQSRQAEQSDVNKSIYRKIEALIPRLRRYARVLTRDTVAAEDLVQDCLARALGKIHLWEQGTDLRAWLFAILHHQHISLARREARQHASIQLQRHRSHSPLSAPQATRLELRDLERALAKLPEEQRSVILLIGLEGMQYEEAASAVNLPVGTVRSRVARGREALRMMTELYPSRHCRRSGPLSGSSPQRPAQRGVAA
jgi:RNA polymerase sigma-70 factor, ECF subfamily